MYKELLSAHLSQLRGKSFSLDLSQLGNGSHRFGAQEVASPAAADLIISVIVVGPDCFYHLSQSPFVFQVHQHEGDSGTSLPVDQGPQPAPSSLDDAGRNPHLTTQGRQEDNQLDGSTSCAVTTS
uniref:Uncharacterized protein n=1 Tax=Oryctolagus cuniculus TaxID=9986 RepID=A0A5F9CRB3_RABIT